jgi:hypothetical protein
MLIREAAGVFWLTLKDIWEELLPLAVVNLVWLLAWALPLSAGSLLASVPALAVALIVIAVLTFAVATAGVYYVSYRVAHAKTFHFSDFLDGVKLYWWRAILWILGNALVTVLLAANVLFYARVQTNWSAIVAGLFVALFIVWAAVQLYFWPLMLSQEQPNLLMAWRNAFYLILANPFYAFFIGSFVILLLALSIGLTLPFVLMGMTLQALLGNNAVLTLLERLGKIESPRPKLT